MSCCWWYEVIILTLFFKIQLSFWYSCYLHHHWYNIIVFIFANLSNYCHLIITSILLTLAFSTQWCNNRKNERKSSDESRWACRGLIVSFFHYFKKYSFYLLFFNSIWIFFIFFCYPYPFHLITSQTNFTSFFILSPENIQQTNSNQT